MPYGTPSRYASSPWALGLCDNCGFSFPLNTLKTYIWDQRPNGLKVCVDCLDKDNPQLQLGRVSADDPQSLLDPRPDIDRQASTTYFGWMPVGNPITQTITCSVGDVTVTTS
jgi:hypothetical protein